jgi:hypothetical protein
MARQIARLKLQKRILQPDDVLMTNRCNLKKGLLQFMSRQ